jgi:predicted RecB family nuclease
MERVGDRIVYSAGDLVDFVACRHLSALEARVAAGREVRPPASAEDQLVWAAGRAHERAYLETLRAAGKTVVDLVSPPSLEGRRAAAAATLEAMRAGAERIHNATFFEPDTPAGGWLGIADFLLRVEGRSDLGDWHYEVADTKLARHAKAATLVQLCVYDELLTRAQGVAPQKMHAILGDGSIATFPCQDFRSYYRRLKERFLAHDSAAPTYPEPVAQCDRCRWFERCEARRRSDDYPSLVAGMRRSQIVKLASSGITTVAALAAALEGAKPKRMEGGTFEKLRAQARRQVEFRETGAMKYDLLPVLKKNHDGSEELDKERGFTLLPPPDDGDLYFDMEGDPFAADGGLEYLFGVAYVDGGIAQFRAFWGHDLRGERAAFEAFVDFVFERRRRFPNLHVYHYASYEPTKLKHLAATHATREEEIDVLLRERVLIDLLNVVRQSIRAPFESYSLKQIERFYSAPRDEEIKDAMGSVIVYARYRETRDQKILDDIEKYNRRDCDSTRGLHAWLCERRAEAEAKFGITLPWRSIGIEGEKKPPKADPERDRVIAALLAPFSGRDPATSDERARALVADLLHYHRREAKPEWWEYFARIERTAEELVEDANAIGCLERTGDLPREEDRSLVIRFRFPVQDHKLHAGSKVLDLDERGITIVAVDDDGCTVDLKRAKNVWHAGSDPRAIFTGKPRQDDVLRGALVRFGDAFATDGARAKYRAVGDLLRGDLPRLKGRVAGAPIDDGRTDANALTELALALDESYLFVQGPPGSGKTWLGAATIVDLIERGLRVGVSAKSHKAIHNLLERVEEVAVERGLRFRGVKRHSNDDEGYYDSKHGLIEPSADLALCTDDDGMQLIAGTAWLFANERMQRRVDVLVIDEAGQVSLADAVASGTAARNLILLGDPMQLPHVSRGTHPPESDRSVLAHLLGVRSTVTPDRGIFLRFTHRLHPTICSFCSQLAYDGRLECMPECALQTVTPPAEKSLGGLEGAGLRYVGVPTEGNVQQSVEEAETIAALIAQLLHGSFTSCKGVTRPLRQSDILVVTPYNMQVRRLRQTLAARGLSDVRVGTVDKFQGQEAPVVFFSMASSRGDELPRSIEFLFDRNRLNVAVSRAQALAILVCSPALLDTSCTKTEQLTMVNMLCRFVEQATQASVVGGGADALDRLVEVG